MEPRGPLYAKASRGQAASVATAALVLVQLGNNVVGLHIALSARAHQHIQGGRRTVWRRLQGCRLLPVTQGGEIHRHVNIPTGVPLVYELDTELKPIKHYYLGDAAEIEAKAAAVAAQASAK